MKALCSLLLAFFICSNSLAQEPKSEPIWPDGAPGALGDEAKDKPQLISYVVPKEKSSGTAIVIFPGGGYGHLAMGHEGHDIAKWLNSKGISAFICDYRHRGKGYGHPAPMQDAQRAIRMVRARAEEIGVQSDQIGIIGFSAGGHLGSTVSNHFDEGDKNSDDTIKQQSCRPDFAILCYPVIAFGTEYAHRGSQVNLLGKDASEEQIEEFSNEKQVTSETPPTFLWHTTEDKGVKVANSIEYFSALNTAGVSCEMHIYEKGRHGLGLAKNSGAANWPHACENWMKERRLIAK